MPRKIEQEQLELLEEIRNLLYRLERNSRIPRPFATTIEFEIKNLNSGEIRERDMNLQLGQNAEIKILAIKDAAGNLAKVEGDLIVWSVKGDLNLGDLEVAADGMSAVFKRNGAVGTCVVECSGDADLGPDVKTLLGQVELVCLGGEAVVFELEANAIPAV